MPNFIPGCPDDTEYGPWSKAYVQTIDGADVIGCLIQQRDDLLALLGSLEGSYSYTPGKWTVAEVIGHITDAERIFAYRALCVARGEKGLLPSFEQDDYMAAANFTSRPLAEITAEFQAVRQASIALLNSLTPEAWMRRGNVGGFSVTARGLAFVLAGHENHHTRILREKYLIGKI